MPINKIKMEEKKYSGQERREENPCLDCKKLKEIKEKNKDLEEKIRELEDKLSKDSHNLRDLTFIEEKHEEKWAEKMKECLLDIKGTVDKAKEGNKQSLDDATQDTFKKKYEVILEEGLKIYPCKVNNLRVLSMLMMMGRLNSYYHFDIVTSSKEIY